MHQLSSLAARCSHSYLPPNGLDTLQADEEASHNQGMGKPHLQKAITPLDLHNTPTPMDAVMHVETSAKTSAKSVLIAFQVRTAFSPPVGCQTIPLFLLTLVHLVPVLLLGSWDSK